VVLLTFLPLPANLLLMSAFMQHDYLSLSSFIMA